MPAFETADLLQVLQKHLTRRAMACISLDSLAHAAREIDERFNPSAKCPPAASKIMCIMTGCGKQAHFITHGKAWCYECARERGYV